MHPANPGETALEAAREAAKDGNYEAVYHFLMAAVHIGDRREDIELVNQVSRLAQAYGKEVDAMRPEHPLSTTAAARRGQTSLFDAVQVHVKAVVVRHRADAARGAQR